MIVKEDVEIAKVGESLARCRAKDGLAGSAVQRTFVLEPQFLVADATTFSHKTPIAALDVGDLVLARGRLDGALIKSSLTEERLEAGRPRSVVAKTVENLQRDVDGSRYDSSMPIAIGSSLRVRCVPDETAELTLGIRRVNLAPPTRTAGVLA